MKSFKAVIDIIGVNPFVFLPEEVLNAIFIQAKKDKEPIQVSGLIEGHRYIQTLVKFSGAWRLYINIPMLKASKKKVGEMVNIQIEFDPIERVIPMHPKLQKALEENIKARQVFESLSPSRKKEIVRYISFLKSEISVDRNIEIAIQFLLGNGRFVGRDRP